MQTWSKKKKVKTAKEVIRIDTAKRFEAETRERERALLQNPKKLITVVE